MGIHWRAVVIGRGGVYHTVREEVGVQTPLHTLCGRRWTRSLFDVRTWRQCRGCAAVLFPRQALADGAG